MTCPNCGGLPLFLHNDYLCMDCREAVDGKPSITRDSMQAAVDHLSKYVGAMEGLGQSAAVTTAILKEFGYPQGRRHG